MKVSVNPRLAPVFHRKACRFLADAERLLRDPPSPDSTVNRAYYAGLMAARAALASRGMDATTHQGRITLFYEQFVDTGRCAQDHASVLGVSLRTRLTADYDATDETPQETAEDLVERARRFVALCQELMGQQRT